MQELANLIEPVATQETWVVNSVVIRKSQVVNMVVIMMIEYAGKDAHCLLPAGERGEYAGDTGE